MLFKSEQKLKLLHVHNTSPAKMPIYNNFLMLYVYSCPDDVSPGTHISRTEYPALYEHAFRFVTSYLNFTSSHWQQLQSGNYVSLPFLYKNKSYTCCFCDIRTMKSATASASLMFKNIDSQNEDENLYRASGNCCAQK